MVDLDQTIIHTTNDEIPSNLKDVYHFQVLILASYWLLTLITRPGVDRVKPKVRFMYSL